MLKHSTTEAIPQELESGLCFGALHSNEITSVKGTELLQNCYWSYLSESHSVMANSL